MGGGYRGGIVWWCCIWCGRERIRSAAGDEDYFEIDGSGSEH